MFRTYLKIAGRSRSAMPRRCEHAAHSPCRGGMGEVPTPWKWIGQARSHVRLLTWRGLLLEWP